MTLFQFLNNSSPAPQQPNNSTLPQNLVQQFYANAPQGYTGSGTDFIKLCLANIGTLIEMYLSVKKSGGVQKLEQQAQQIIKSGQISDEQLGEIKKATESFKGFF